MDESRFIVRRPGLHLEIKRTGDAPETAVTSMNKSASVKRLTSNAVLPPAATRAAGGARTMVWVRLSDMASPL